MLGLRLWRLPTLRQLGLSFLCEYLISMKLFTQCVLVIPQETNKFDGSLSNSLKAGLLKYYRDRFHFTVTVKQEL